MKFGYTILYVPDVAETLTFYERAFGFTRKMLHENQYGELDTGGTTLAFSATVFVKTLMPVAFAEAAPAGSAPPFEVGFVTDAVEEAYATAVAAGAIAVKAPERKPWGQTVGYVRDLNGFLIELCSPVS